MYKQHQVVLVATNEKSNISLGNSGKGLIYHNDITPDYSERTYQNLYILSEEKIEAGDWFLNTRNNTINKAETFHGSVGYFNSDKTAHLNIQKWFKKIIASTDKSLLITDYVDCEYPLPQIHQSFVEYFVTEFNKGNVIDRVDVEYEEYPIIGTTKTVGGNDEIGYKLKINPDNTINIKPIKESWSREELADILPKYGAYILTHIGKPLLSSKDWIEQNL